MYQTAKGQIIVEMLKGGYAVASSLVVLAFEGRHTAEGMLLTLDRMEKEGLLELEDAVVASRAQGANVEIHHARSKSGKFALRGGGVGLLAGLLVGGPIGAFNGLSHVG